MRDSAALSVGGNCRSCRGRDVRVEWPAHCMLFRECARRSTLHPSRSHSAWLLPRAGAATGKFKPRRAIATTTTKALGVRRMIPAARKTAERATPLPTRTDHRTQRTMRRATPSMTWRTRLPTSGLRAPTCVISSPARPTRVARRTRGPRSQTESSTSPAPQAQDPAACPRCTSTRSHPATSQPGGCLRARRLAASASLGRGTPRTRRASASEPSRCASHDFLKQERCKTARPASAVAPRGSD